MASKAPALLNGRYQVTGASMSGGTGNILICDDLNLSRKVAIKFLQSSTDRRRIFDEIKALQKIRSKNVVEIFDIVIDGPDNRVGIVQEYITGKDFLEISKTMVDVNSYLNYLYQISLGIADMHSQKIIHRDIKPNNMILDSERIVKIFDFDLARPIGDAANTVGFRGTIGFAAPELYQHGHVIFTEKVDVYAFGATAIYLSEGDLPSALTANPPVADSWLSVHGFSSLRIKLPTDLAALLDNTLEKDPDNRPDMSTICTAIARHILKDGHRALLTHLGKNHILDKTNRSVTVGKPGVGNVTIAYDGLDFEIHDINGDVWINNTQIRKGMIMPGSCVIALGGPTVRNNERVFVTMDVSHPEVVL